jgi:hypothetical protein
MYVLAHCREIAHGGNQAIRRMPGVRAGEADPADARDGADSFE